MECCIILADYRIAKLRVETLHASNLQDEG
jgi:hypothetical protein